MRFRKLVRNALRAFANNVQLSLATKASDGNEHGAAAINICRCAHYKALASARNGFDSLASLHLKLLSNHQTSVMRQRLLARRLLVLRQPARLKLNFVRR